MEDFVKELINCVISNSEVTKSGGIITSITCNEEIEYNINQYIKQQKQD
jgi:retron-type reverse transcriptase